MDITTKNELWNQAVVFRGTKSSSILNDIIKQLIKDQFKNLVKDEFKNTEFAKNVKFNWHCTAQDDSVEYFSGKFSIDKDKLSEDREAFMMMRPNFVDYGDGRSIFLDGRFDFFPGEEGETKEFECNGGIRYFKDSEVKDPFIIAEKFIENYFSTARLLQLKVWWDAYPHESTPKLASVYQWSDGVVKSAIGGATTFEPAPFTFAEIAEEIATSTV